MNKEKFEAPDIQIIIIETLDVMTTSFGSELPYGNEPTDDIAHDIWGQ